MTNPIILMRASLAEEEELSIARKYFTVIEQRSHVSDLKPPFLVIPRYSCLPYYKELEEDIKYFGGELINSYRQHLYIADMKNWYEDLEDMTAKTWFRLEDVPRDGGPFFLKGATNSKKFLWNTHAYAKDIHAAVDVYHRLSQDALIGQQDIYVRQYVPLVKLADGLNGLMITDEYRVFVAYGKILSMGYYWASHTDDLDKIPSAEENVPKDFIQKVIDRVGDKADAYVVDVARTQAGEWIIVELNDLQMSGLSCNDPYKLYNNLKTVLENTNDLSI